MMKHFLLLLFVCLAADALRPAAAAAQAGATAQVAGTVRDASGGVLPGVDVTVTQTATGFMRTVVTDATGAYTLPNLPIGPYRLEANLQGFRSYVRTGIVLQVGGSPVIDITLELGELTEAITVQANAALVETRSTGVGQVIENQRVLELPLNGRQVTDLLLLSPGVTLTAAGPGQFSSNRSYPTASISVAGGSPGSTVYLMDGANHNDPGTNFNLPVPFPDALQEFRVETSALPARYGNHAAAIVSLVTKSGSNEYHGSLFEFVRNGAFNARNAFALSKDSLKRNQFGGALGGPIVANRIFFFGGYQGTVIRTDPSTLQAFVPTTAMLRGDFTAAASPACNSGRQITLGAPFVNNQVDPSRFDPVALRYLEYIPVSTDPCGRYQYGYPTPSTDHQYLGKVDYQLNARHSMFVRHMDIRYDLPYYFDGKNALTTPSVGVKNRGRAFVLGDSYALGPNVINTLRFTAIRSQNTRGAAPFKSPADMGTRIATTERAGAFTNLSVTNAFSLGGGGNNNAAYDYHTFQIADDFDMVRGAHQITFGFDFMHQRMSVFNTQYSNGQFTFNGQITGLPLADFLVGRIAQLQQGTDTLLRERSKTLAVYAQDAWRIGPRVTVNAGVRFEPYFPLTNDDDHVLLFDPARFAAGLKGRVYTNAPAGLIFPGDEGYPGTAMSKGNPWRFGPRVGVVYDPRGEGREAIRAAYGMMHDQPPMFHHIRVASVPPWGSLITLNNVSLSDPYSTFPGGNPFPRTLTRDATFPLFGTYWTQQLEADTPNTQHWNVSVQRQFGENWAVTASYFGNKSSNVWVGMEINPAVYMPGATTGNTNQRRLLYLQNPAEGQYFASVTQLNMDGEGHYNGLLLAVQKRFSDGYSVTANHTWSHCVADADGQQFLDPVYTQPGNPKADRGDCSSDRRHVFNATAVVNPPAVGTGTLAAITGGWQFSTIFQALTGAPLNVTLGQDNALTGMPNQRPDLVGDWKRDEPTYNAWFNTAAFARPAPGTYGTLRRNALRGPASWNVDAVLSRRFEFGREQRFEFRAEAFNLFNHIRPGVSQGVNGFAGVGNPNTVFTNVLFGRITTAADPRILQFALKYVF
ncbi:MAG: TonB-dependent receptor [Acidobacteria bacterium]|nr:TonB-dependent receptor [Acidobacteriota bacterium]